MAIVRYGNRIVTVPEGTRISDLPPYKEQSALPCGGHGLCGKCKVYAIGALSPLSETERSRLTDEEIRAGIRLACCTSILGDCTVESNTDRGMHKIRTVGDMPNLLLAPQFHRYGVCVDIGTTTLAARLYDANGRLLAEAGGMNPQSGWGADVISRIEAALAGEAAAIARAVRHGVNELVLRLAQEANIASTEIDRAVITGNTVMLHLLTETSVEPLSHAPFAAKRLFDEVLTAEELSLTALSPTTPVYLPPCMEAFVGADITTALLASEICRWDETRLLVDIGTNGEMALWQNGTLYCCSTAAGPAFEGAGISMGMGGKTGAIDRVQIVNGRLSAHVIGEGAPEGICGSGVIDVVACLLDLELLDETGYLEDDPTVVESPVTFTQADVRAVQLAKSAIHAGIRTLLSAANLPMTQLKELVIAGGFGSYLSIPSAIRMGLIPTELRGRIRVIGNAALSGAAMLLFSEDLRHYAAQLAERAQIISLSTNPVFAEEYMERMAFE